MILINGEEYNPYVEERKRSLDLAKKMYKQYGEVEYSKTDNWVRINGVVINTISREDMKEIMEGKYGTRKKFSN